MELLVDKLNHAHWLRIIFIKKIALKWLQLNGTIFQGKDCHFVHFLSAPTPVKLGTNSLQRQFSQKFRSWVRLQMGSHITAAFTVYHLYALFHVSSCILAGWSIVHNICIDKVYYLYVSSHVSLYDQHGWNTYHSSHIYKVYRLYVPFHVSSYYHPGWSTSRNSGIYMVYSLYVSFHVSPYHPTW